MPSRKIDDLHPEVAKRAIEFKARCEMELNITLLITNTYRAGFEQAELYGHGRNPVALIAAGIDPKYAQPKLKVVTKASPGRSYHEFRLALDVVPLVAGKPIWDAEHPIWAEIGRIGKECGLEWAGDWPGFIETAHFQYSENHNLAQIKSGATVGGLTWIQSASRWQ